MIYAVSREFGFSDISKEEAKQTRHNQKSYLPSHTARLFFLAPLATLFRPHSVVWPL